ncbi:MAG: hypothetical protein ACJ79W_03835 [Myxococcales bacterium]
MTVNPCDGAQTVVSSQTVVVSDGRPRGDRPADQPLAWSAAMVISVPEEDLAAASRVLARIAGALSARSEPPPRRSIADCCQ